LVVELYEIGYTGIDFDVRPINNFAKDFPVQDASCGVLIYNSAALVHPHGAELSQLLIDSRGLAPSLPYCGAAKDLTNKAREITRRNSVHVSKEGG